MGGDKKFVRFGFNLTDHGHRDWPCLFRSVDSNRDLDEQVREIAQGTRVFRVWGILDNGHMELAYEAAIDYSGRFPTITSGVGEYTSLSREAKV